VYGKQRGERGGCCKSTTDRTGQDRGRAGSINVGFRQPRRCSCHTCLPSASRLRYLSFHARTSSSNCLHRARTRSVLTRRRVSVSLPSMSLQQQHGGQREGAIAWRPAATPAAGTAQFHSLPALPRTPARAHAPPDELDWVVLEHLQVGGAQADVGHDHLLAEGLQQPGALQRGGEAGGSTGQTTEQGLEGRRQRALMGTPVRLSGQLGNPPLLRCRQARKLARKHASS